MLPKKLKNYNIILASGSPRRHAFLKAMTIPFEVKLHPIKEVYPNHLKAEEITNYLAKQKAQPFLKNLQPNHILITSDTIVWHNNKAVEKPTDLQDAFNMIKGLSNSTHSVFTSVCVSTKTQQKIVNCETKVTFKALTDEEIWYYVNTYKPLDKAGAYGIQEWIGAIGITKIEGSYNNVVGLPTHLLFAMLNKIIKDFKP